MSHYEWQNYSATITNKKTIIVKDVLNEIEEQLDFSDRIIKVAIAYGYLVATTPNQCHIYSTTNWNTPTIFDLKDGSVNHLLLSEKYVAIVERTTINIYNYQGRMVASPRWNGLNPDTLNKFQISLSSDTLAVCDQTERKNVNIVDLGSNRTVQDALTSLQHHTNICQIALNQAGAASARQLAIIDSNKDLYLISVRATHKSFSKLAIQDIRLVVWYTPSAAYFSQQMLKLSSLQYDSSELGKSPKVSWFDGAAVQVRRADGSLLNIPISNYILVLLDYTALAKWQEALNLCRMVQDGSLWASVAVLATQARLDALETAEEAYAAINQLDKVAYIQYIKTLTKKPQQMAAAALLAGSIQEAESILLHNSMVYQAIATNVQMHNWSRALELAVKHKTHIDTVLYLRKKYLQSINKEENNSKFLKLSETIPLDEEKIAEKLRLENLKS